MKEGERYGDIQYWLPHRQQQHQRHTHREKINCQCLCDDRRCRAIHELSIRRVRSSSFADIHMKI